MCNIAIISKCTPLLTGTEIFHFLDQTEEASGMVLTTLFQIPYTTKLVIYQKQNIANTPSKCKWFCDDYSKIKLRCIIII